jgi:hypothetical protein
MTSNEILITMVSCVFTLGTITFVIGLIILLTRTMGKDIRAITSQTSKLAQKGLAEDLAGLVGNASVLLNATSELVRTNSGIGLLLIFLGLAQMAASITLLFFIIRG